MFSEFLNIIIRSIRLDKTLYKDNKNFGEASIYFAIIIILLTAIISLMPGSIFLKFMSGAFGTGTIQGPSIRSVIITSIIVWLIKTAYLYFVGVVLFPNKATKCNYRKILVTVGYASAPLILNAFIVDIKLLYFMFIPYIWYNVSLIIGINHILKFDNYFKSAIIVLGPIILLFLFFVTQLFGSYSSTIS
jgi:hypothetical protein|tara:strand:- start:5612 stop:6181 length:570 start_codon:yes stop_codon:yes gene_type:complete